MAERVKTIRLSSRVADELGVGIPTIIEFLTQKGYEALRPNAKISEEIYQVLLKEFQSDKIVKEKAKLAGTEKIEKETITLKEAEGSKEEIKANIEQDEVVIKDVQNIIAEDRKEEELITDKPKRDIDVKVVGKVDIETLKPQIKPEEKDKEKEEKKNRIIKNKVLVKTKKFDVEKILF